MKDTNIGAIATFSCNRGYRLIGEASIICNSIGHWSRPIPSCRKIGKENFVVVFACVLFVGQYLHVFAHFKGMGLLWY